MRLPSCQNSALTSSDSSFRFVPLLQRNEPRAMRSTNTRPTMLNRFAAPTLASLHTPPHPLRASRANLLRNRELGKIMPHHLRLNLHLIELLARVDTDNTPNHLRHNNHIAQMCLHQIRLLVGLGFLFRFAKFLDEAHGLAFETAVESAAGAGMDYIAELFAAEIEEFVEIDAAVGEFAEGSLLLQLCGGMLVLLFRETLG